MVIHEVCEGNPGAMTFLAEAFAVDLLSAATAFERMQNNNITGSKLYMLWNDCCDRNTVKALQIMLNNTIEDIIEHINEEHGRGIRYE